MKRKNAAIGRYLYFLLLYVGACFVVLLFGLIVSLMNIDKWPHYREFVVFPIIASIFIPFIIYNLAQMIYYMNVKFVDIQTTKIIDCDTEEIRRGRLFGTYTSIAFYVKVVQNGEKKQFSLSTLVIKLMALSTNALKLDITQEEKSGLSLNSILG